jgi:ribosomal protein S18 acetylase RimI-like enzyme
MVELTLTTEEHPTAETAQVLRASLDEFNFARVGPDDERPLAVMARDSSQRIQAGLYGKTYWKWLYIEFLWISEQHRGSGVGSRLLRQAEAIAGDRGCLGVWLNTISFQAPGFYERHGYREFGRLDEMPPGHKRIWFAKRLPSVQVQD